METKDIKSGTHRRKMIAPVVVTVILTIYYAFFFGALLTIIKSTVYRLLLGIIPALSGVVLVGVCVERIKEIKGGEEDDLGQY